MYIPISLQINYTKCRFSEKAIMNSVPLFQMSTLNNPSFLALHDLQLRLLLLAFQVAIQSYQSTACRLMSSNCYCTRPGHELISIYHFQ